MHYDRDRLLALDLEHVWHPYTQMRDYARRDPVIIWRGEGRRLQDVDGRWYWDGVSSIWLNVHGHNVPELNRAIEEQLQRIAHATLLGQANVPAILLAERLVRIAPPGLRKVFYSDNGSGAVEAALKMAVQYWYQSGRPEKHRVLSFVGGYHGDTLGAVAVAPVPAFHEPFYPLLRDPIQAPYPDRYDCPGCRGPCRLECLNRLEELLRSHAHELAAVFVEPLVQGVGGIRVMPDGYLRALRELCTRYEVLLVADEVATGFGRTGRMFACDHEGISPDLMAVGKGITGGYLPLAATLATDRIYEAFLGEYAERKAFFHGHSYTGNPLGCAVALANLDLLEALLPQLPARERLIAHELERFRQLPFVGQVRQKGFMVGIELVGDPQRREPFPWEARAGWLVAWRARELGLLIRPYAHVVIFMPPLASTEAELQEMLALLYEAHQRAIPDLERAARGEWS